MAATRQPVGIEVGLQTFATLSTSQEVANPRFFRSEEHARAKMQRRVSTEEKGTAARARRRRTESWRGCMNARAGDASDFTHQHSRRIVNTFDVIAGEDLSVNRMTHNHGLTHIHGPAKSIHDAAWSQFKETGAGSPVL